MALFNGLCPDCFLPLVRHLTRGVEGRGCTNCNGLWLGCIAVAVILPPAEVPIQATALEAETRGVARSHRKCPGCRQRLRRLLVVAAGVVLDACSAHGTWFDPQELFYVMRALEDARRGSCATSAYRGDVASPPEPLRLVPVTRDVPR